MKRAEILPEIWKMRFEKAYSVWTKRRLNQEKKARILGVCTRTFRRYIDRYEERGMDGLLDKRLTQASSRRAPVDEVIALARQPMTKFFVRNPTPFPISMRYVSYAEWPASDNNRPFFSFSIWNV